jgi:hypothetical protein
MKNMKKTLAVAVAVIAVGLLAGCATHVTTKGMPEGTPDFVVDTPVYSGQMVGIGGCKLSGDQQAMQIAAGRARQSIAAQVNTRAQAMITEYADRSGFTDDAVTQEFYEAVNRLLVNQTLRGSKVVKQEKGADGTWWVMIVYDTSEAAKMAAKATEELIAKQEARYSSFKAMQAQKELEDRLSGDDVKPIIITK